MLFVSFLFILSIHALLVSEQVALATQSHHGLPIPIPIKLMNVAIWGLGKIVGPFLKYIKIPSQSQLTNGFNITAQNIKIISFTAPSITLRPEPKEDSMYIDVKGGNFKITAEWTADGPLMLNGAGKMTVVPKPGGVDITSMVKTLENNGQTHLGMGDCQAKTGFKMIHDDVSGLGSMMETVTGTLEPLIELMINNEVCKTIGKKVNDVLKEHQLKFTSKYALHYGLDSFSVGNYWLTLYLTGKMGTPTPDVNGKKKRGWLFGNK